MSQQSKKTLYLADDFDSLHKLADVEFKAGGWILKHAETAKKLFAAAEAASQVGDEEKAFVYYMRYLNLLDKVCCTQEYRKKKEQQPELVVPLFSMRSPAGMKAIQEAERLKESLKIRYEQRARTQAQQHQRRQEHESSPSPPPYTLEQEPPPPYADIEPTTATPSAPPLEQMPAPQIPPQQMPVPVARPVPPTVPDVNYRQPPPRRPPPPVPPAPPVPYPVSQPPLTPGHTGMTPIPQNYPAYPSDHQSPTAANRGPTPHVPLYPTIGDSSTGTKSTVEPSPLDGATQGVRQPTGAASLSEPPEPHEVPRDQHITEDEDGRASPDQSDFVVYSEKEAAEDQNNDQDNDSTVPAESQQPEVPTCNLEARSVLEDASSRVPGGEEERDVGIPEKTPTLSGQEDTSCDEGVVLPPGDEYGVAGAASRGGTDGDGGTEEVRETGEEETPGQDGGMEVLADDMGSLHLPEVPSDDLFEDVPGGESTTPSSDTQDTGSGAGNSTRWPCVKCTYLNEEWRHHCEMCYNSRNTSFIGNPGFTAPLHHVALQPESEREPLGPRSDQSPEDSGDEDYNSAPEDDITGDTADEGDRLTWVCHRCTYVNTGVSPICSMCRVLRRVDYAVPDETGEDNVSSRFGRLTRPPLRSTGPGASAASSLSGGTALLDSLRQRLAMNQGYHKHNVTVSRESIHSDVIGLYSDTDRRIWTHQIRVTFKGEPSVDVKGVSREMFTIFWEDVKQRATCGSDVRLPISTPEYNQRYWEAVGRALCHCYVLVGHYPVDVIPEVITLHILDKKPTKAAIQEAFLNTLTETERTLLKSLFDNYTQENFKSKKSDLRDFLINCEIQTVPTFEDFPEIFHRVAEFKVFEEPKSAILGIASGFGEASADVFKEVTMMNIHALYSSLQPTANNIIGKLELITQRGEGPRVFSMLTSFLYNSTEDVCRKFLRYVTGSNLLSMDQIKVRVDPGVCGIESHTCFNEIALPTFKECSTQEEFNQVWMTLLEDTAAWEYNLT